MVTGYIVCPCCNRKFLLIESDDATSSGLATVVIPEEPKGAADG